MERGRLALLESLVQLEEQEPLVTTEQQVPLVEQEPLVLVEQAERWVQLDFPEIPVRLEPLVQSVQLDQTGPLVRLELQVQNYIWNYLPYL